MASSELYTQDGRRQRPSLPLRIEIDLFFSYLRDEHCRGADYIQAPLLEGEARRSNVRHYLDQWFVTQWPYLDHIAAAYGSITKLLGTREAIQAGTINDLLEALEVCHAFKEELRFHAGGLPTLRQEFRRLNDLDRIRASLTYLLHGEDYFIDRMGTVIFDPAFRLAKCGRSVVQELLGWVNREDIPLCNGRTLKVLRFLGYDVKL